MTFHPLHGTGGGLDPVPVVVGAMVGFAIWFAIKWLAASGNRKRGGV